MTIIKLLLLTACLFILPVLTLGLQRKAKAIAQGLSGESILRPLRDLLKMLDSDDSVDGTSPWVFRFDTAISLGTILFVSMIVPWVSFKPSLAADDLFYLLYLLLAMRFFRNLAATDSGATLSESRIAHENYLSKLIDPAMFISLTALGIVGHSSKLSVIFDYGHLPAAFELPVWLCAAIALFLCSVIELSATSIDATPEERARDGDRDRDREQESTDETRLDDDFGKQAALAQFTHLLKMVVLYGLSVQCVLHVLVYFTQYHSAWFAAASVFGIMLISIGHGIFEALALKHKWNHAARFTAYGLTVSVLAIAGAVIEVAIARPSL